LEILIYRPGAKKAEARTCAAPEMTFCPAIKHEFASIIGCLNIEHVCCLFEGQRADMFVDETGSHRLPYNALATDIYHAYSKSRGASMANAPSIYGVAILCVKPRRIWV
jgi:hypothetical protein